MPSWKKAIIFAIVLAIITAAVVIGIAFTSEPEPVTLEDVKEQAEQARTTPSTAPATISTEAVADHHTPSVATAQRITEAGTYTPSTTVLATADGDVKLPEGIYAYDTEGSEKVHLGPGQSHTYPEETYVRYTPTACGFEAVWEPIEGRRNVYRICVDPFTLVTYDQDHAFFGQTDHRSFYCDPPLRLDVTGTGSCWQDGKAVRVDNTVTVQHVNVAIEGKHIAARKVTLDAELEGDANGTQHSEWWFAEDGLLLLQVVSNIATDAKTILGAIDYTETVTLKIKSLEPVG